MEQAVLFVSYMNGSVRTPEGKLVAFWDEPRGILHVDGVVEEFKGMFNLEEAMDMVAKYFKK